MEKWQIDRRIAQMEAEGVSFRTGVFVGKTVPGADRHQLAQRNRHARRTARAVRRRACSPAAPKRRATCRCRAASSTASTSRWNSCRSRTRSTPATRSRTRCCANGKHVVVIGGGDTGSRLRRHREPPRREERHAVRAAAAAARAGEQAARLAVLADQAAHLVVARGRLRARLGDRDQGFDGKNGKVETLNAVRVEWKDGKMVEVPGTRVEMKADLVLLAMGFVSPVRRCSRRSASSKDARGNAKAGDRRRRRLRDHRRQGVHRRRHAARPVAGGVGDPRRPPGARAVDAIPDGFERRCRAEPMRPSLPRRPAGSEPIRSASADLRWSRSTTSSSATTPSRDDPERRLAQHSRAARSRRSWAARAAARRRCCA